MQTTTIIPIPIPTPTPPPPPASTNVFLQFFCDKFSDSTMNDRNHRFGVIARSLASNPNISWDDIVAHPTLFCPIAEFVVCNPSITYDMLPMIAHHFQADYNSYLSIYCFNNPRISVDEYCQYFHHSAQIYLCKSSLTTIDTIKNNLQLFNWRNYLGCLLSNSNCSAYSHELCELLNVSLEEKEEDSSCQWLNSCSSRDDVMKNKNLINHYFANGFIKLCLLTEDDMIFLLDHFVNTYQFTQSPLALFGACPCVTLDIIEKWLLVPAYLTSIHYSFAIALSKNPNLTFEFVENHPDVEWDYVHLANNPMTHHSCFNKLYVLK